MRINVDALRDYLLDYYGTAAAVVNPVAMTDVYAIEHMSAYELCHKALQEGIDLTKFEV